MKRRLVWFAVFLAIPFLLTSCGSSPPLIRGLELTMTPNTRVPLASQIALSTDRPTTVDVEFDDGERTWRVETGLAYSMDHVVPILGMRPGRQHQVRLVVRDESGLTASTQPLTLTTDPLPDDFPSIEVLISEPDRMEEGVTMFDVIHWPASGTDNNYGLLVALDSAGEVVWYYKTGSNVGDARRLSNGNILYMSGRAGHLYEIDMLGNVMAEWHTDRVPEEELGEGSIRVDTETFHHEAYETVSGNILTISSEVRRFERYPTSATDPAAPRSTSNVLGDVLVEFTRRGDIVREAKLLDLLDPYRVGYDSLGGGFWAPVYTETFDHPLRDWAHTNAVVSDSTGRYAMASLRAQDAVVKIDLETGELVWILGEHGGWGPEWQDYLLTPVGDFMWQYHQHAPMFTPEGTILMFDNGNNRAWPFELPMPSAESFSRAVEYRVDEDKMEIEQVWSYGGPGDEHFFSTFISDADWLPATGNVLVADGGRVREEDGHHWARIVEVTHTTPAEKVFEVVIDDEAPEGWAVFRAERLPSLYP